MSQVFTATNVATAARLLRCHPHRSTHPHPRSMASVTCHSCLPLRREWCHLFRLKRRMPVEGISIRSPSRRRHPGKHPHGHTRTCIQGGTMPDSSSPSRTAESSGTSAEGSAWPSRGGGGHPGHAAGVCVMAVALLRDGHHALSGTNRHVTATRLFHRLVCNGTQRVRDGLGLAAWCASCHGERE